MHYTTNGGTGQDVVLVHGNSLSSGIWKAQLEDPSLAHLHLIAIDLPGHGRSARYDPDTAYTLEGFADNIATFIKDMRAPVLVAHSLGGHICMRVLHRSANVRGLMLSGTPPLASAADFATAFLPTPVLAKAFQPDISGPEALELAKAMTWDSCPMVQEMAEWVLKADPRVRSDIGMQLATGQLADERAMLRDWKELTCMVNGGDDKSIAPAFLEGLAAEFFWRERVNTIAGTGHCPQVQRPNQFNQILAEYVADR